MYKRKPVGEYHVGVCTNALCAVMGGDAIFADLTDHLGVGVDEATPDGKVSVEHVECNAACDYAPVVMVNWEFFDNMTPQSARELVDGLRSGADVKPDPRRARGCAPGSRPRKILAGFPDGQARPAADSRPSRDAGRAAHRQGSSWPWTRGRRERCWRQATVSTMLTPS